MSVEAAVIDLLLADTSTAGIVGTKVHPESLPQSAQLPALIVSRVSGGPLYADDGEVGLSSVRLQIDCYADTYTDAKELAEAVRAVLSGFDGTSGSTVIQFAMLESERDDRESGANVSKYPFRIIQDWQVWEEG